MDISRPHSVDPQFHLPGDIRPFFERLLENSIEFNAAANAAVDSSRRPIRSRVLRRVRESKTFEKILLSIVIASATRELELEKRRASEVLTELKTAIEKDAAIETALATGIFDLLAGDRRFSTLLLEEIEQDKKWGDLFEEDFTSWKDRLRAFFEKLFDKQHPITRTAAALLVSGASVVASYNIALQVLPKIVTDKLTVEIPFKPVAVEARIPVKLDVKADPQTVSIRIEPPDPINLKLIPAGPLKMNVTPNVIYPDPGGSKNMGAPPRPGIGVTVLSSPAKLTEPLHVVVDGVPQPVEKFANQTEQYWKDFEFLKAKLASMDTLTQAVNQQLADYQATSSITVTEKATGSVLLQWLDGKLQPASCELQAHVGTVGRSGSSVDFTPTNCSGSFQPPDNSQPPLPVQLEINQPKKLVGLPFHVMAIAVDRHLFAKPQIQLRFQPDSILLNALSGSSPTQNLASLSPR
jgi:hypothetical protein